MTAVIEQVVSRIDGIDADPFCHLFGEYGAAPRARCGVPREEQEPHRVLDSQLDRICRSCGRRRCPRCRARQ